MLLMLLLLLLLLSILSNAQVLRKNFFLFNKFKSNLSIVKCGEFLVAERTSTFVRGDDDDDGDDVGGDGDDND